MPDHTFRFLSAAQHARPRRVARTGIALVHENEIVYPAAGSAAEAVRALDDASGSVQVYFPVQIEIRDASGQSQRDTGLNGHAAAPSAEQIAQAIDPGSS